MQFPTAITVIGATFAFFAAVNAGTCQRDNAYGTCSHRVQVMDNGRRTWRMLHGVCDPDKRCPFNGAACSILGQVVTCNLEG